MVLFGLILLIRDSYNDANTIYNQVLAVFIVLKCY